MVCPLFSHLDVEDKLMDGVQAMEEKKLKGLDFGGSCESNH